MLAPEERYRRPNTGLSPVPEKTDEIRQHIDSNGQTRLNDIREEYTGRFFQKAILELVEQGEIALVPVGDHVHVRTE